MLVETAERFRQIPFGREAARLIDACVQCGQCTVRCPTFRLTNDEWDGPRGRIYLTKQFLEDRAPTLHLLPPAYELRRLTSPDFRQDVRFYLDRCLGCRSCEASCPQGVRYGRLLDFARVLLEREMPRPLKERVLRQLVRSIVPYPARFTLALRTAQLLRPLLPASAQRLIPPLVRSKRHTWPQPSHRRTMVVWQGCVQPALAPGINFAAARVLDRLGISLVPAKSGCCGAISLHMGMWDEAQQFMRKAIDSLWHHVNAGAQAIVVTSSGCGMHLREYGELLADDPAYREKAQRVSSLVRDVAEVITAEWAPGQPPEVIQREETRITFQAPCSLQHGEKLAGVVEALLRRTGYKVLPVAYGFTCCGAAGSYKLFQPKIAEQLRQQKLKTLVTGRAELIATANIGCLTHLAAASPLPVYHWLELLDARLK